MKKPTEMTRLTNNPCRTSKAHENKGVSVDGNVCGNQQSNTPVGGDVILPALFDS